MAGLKIPGLIKKLKNEKKELKINNNKKNLRGDKLSFETYKKMRERFIGDFKFAVCLVAKKVKEKNVQIEFFFAPSFLLFFYLIFFLRYLKLRN